MYAILWRLHVASVHNNTFFSHSGESNDCVLQNYVHMRELNMFLIKIGVKSVSYYMLGALLILI